MSARGKASFASAIVAALATLASLAAVLLSPALRASALARAAQAEVAQAQAAPTPAGQRATAVFAGGCFWCMVPPFDALPGVIATTSGYAGGTLANPTYQQVSAGNTGHKEVVRVTYDPGRVSYEQLLAVYWRNIDPLNARGQFCDTGNQYTSAIFVTSEAERGLAEKSKATVAARLGSAVATEILPAATFYPAEDYHQDYYKKNPLRYSFYRSLCGRDRRLKELNGTS
jgi:peptide-methionine (S)-S-oxide reductase